ncbi:helix-turn-helix domain-containing protein [Geoalkalibacter sp.]|uniref:helix-turn-helix domain-containing protein n=1 Tax=Geoalkalibacter sp. TaxID=3041440 RepID=UPI00272E04D0|nr:helix-turn-helix domain-containing protein [Geoalkalibacter sp.]
MLRAIRMELGEKKETQREMAEKAGVTRSMITHVENKNFILEDVHLQRIAKAYGQDPFEQELLLRKLRRAVVYTRNPAEFESTQLLPSEMPSRPEEPQAQILPTALRIRIEQTLLYRDLRAQNLAELTGIDEHLVRRYLSGEEPVRMEDARKICEALGDVFSEWLLLMGKLPEGLLALLREKPILCKVLALLEDSPGHLVQMVLEDVESRLKAKGGA